MIIKGGNVVLPEQVLENTDVKAENGIITEIGKNLSGDEIIDASGKLVCPGFIDIHTHGGHGSDFMDDEDDAFETALSFHYQNGTTSLLATSVTAPPEDIVNMLGKVRKHKKKENPSCRVLGAHIEGPYISLKNKGAQPERFLRVPANDSYDFILENADVVKTVTIAPELDGAAEMTAKLREKGIVVCGGHDDGEKDKILPVIEAGLSHCTHLWCATSMVAIRNGVRNVGLLEIGLLDDRLTVEIIGDNHHIPPELARLIFKCKGADKMCLVSDSLRAGGMPKDGRLYSLGRNGDEASQKFIVSDGVARLPDGTRFAGSIQPVSQMVKNLVDDAGISIADAVKCASLTPARVIGVSDRYGEIKVGKAADFCIMDKELAPVCTIVGGRVVYTR